MKKWMYSRLSTKGIDNEKKEKERRIVMSKNIKQKMFAPTWKQYKVPLNVNMMPFVLGD
jgi:hypothetical protein